MEWKGNNLLNCVVTHKFQILFLFILCEVFLYKYVQVYSSIRNKLRAKKYKIKNKKGAETISEPSWWSNKKIFLYLYKPD